MLNLGINLLLDGDVLSRLSAGLLVTLEISVISISLSWLLGTLLGVMRTLPNPLLRFLFRCYLEIFRFIPILIWLYLFYYVLSSNFAINLPSGLVAILVFVLWGSSEMSDIVRSALISLPKHQLESGQALGLSNHQLYFFVLIPQALKLMVPSAINLSVRMIMTTSLLFTLGVVDVIKVGQQIIEAEGLSNPMAPFWIYGAILLLYFLICYPLSLYAKKRINNSTEAVP